MDLNTLFNAATDSARNEVLEFWVKRQKSTCCICVLCKQQEIDKMPPRLDFELFDLKFSEPNRVDNYRAAHSGCIEYLEHLNRIGVIVDICNPDYKPEWFRKAFKRRRHRQRRQRLNTCKIAAE